MIQQQAHFANTFKQQPVSSVVQSEPVRQIFGFILFIIFSIITIVAGGFVFILAAAAFDQHFFFIFSFILYGLGFWILSIFFIVSLAKPTYLGGKPSFMKLLPFSAGIFLVLFGLLAIFMGNFLFALLAIVPTCIYSTVASFLFLGDDRNVRFIYIDGKCVLRSSRH